VQSSGVSAVYSRIVLEVELSFRQDAFVCLHSQYFVCDWCLKGNSHGKAEIRVPAEGISSGRRCYISGLGK